MIQNLVMDNTLYSGLYLERHDCTRNLHRAYGLRVVRSLFGHWGVVRQWGRVGRPGRTRTDWFETLSEAEHALTRRLREKRRRGYR